MQRREHSKVMIVLSDGYPAAAGAGNLKAHLKKTVRDIEASGVRLVGIGIESEAVREFYTRNLVLNSVNDLPAAVMKQLRGLLMV
jgi:cobalamin biosynthesis protein CobT